MTSRPSLGELLLGVEGLALLRLTFVDDPAARQARVSEIRALLHSIDGTSGLDAAVYGPEYDLADGYRLWSETYDAPLRLFGLEEPVMHRLFDSLPASLVLDAACGTGRHSQYLAARGHRLVGVDQSSEMLERARRRAPDGDFREGNLEGLPIGSGSVDVVVCALALVHLPDITGAIQEFARVVRPGGRVIISDVHPFVVLLGWQAQFRTAAGATGFMRIHWHLPSDYCRAFAAAGLRVRSCDEPLLTPESAVTPAADRLPDANRAAFVGLPGVIVWDVEKER
ncbi:MAG TPA: methyltransferase domain-containing protein [Candidatus Methylomirabilis sp.]|nr:methyltransferase domain-containing protein [Candidatus Methylomirabilis sp.]